MTMQLLARCLKSVEGGKWRDGAGLSAEAHPVWDDVREYLAQPIRHTIDGEPFLSDLGRNGSAGG